MFFVTFLLTLLVAIARVQCGDQLPPLTVTAFADVDTLEAGAQRTRTRRDKEVFCLYISVHLHL